MVYYSCNFLVIETNSDLSVLNQVNMEDVAKFASLTISSYIRSVELPSLKSESNNIFDVPSDFFLYRHLQFL